MSSSKKGSLKPDSRSEWNEWVWDERWQHYWRSRERADGKWEYEYRQPEEENTPRTSQLDLTSTGHEYGSESQIPDYQRTIESAYTTTGRYGGQSSIGSHQTIAGPRSDFGLANPSGPIFSITEGISTMGMSPMPEQPSIPSRSRGLPLPSMVDSSGVPIRRHTVQQKGQGASDYDKIEGGVEERHDDYGYEDEYEKDDEQPKSGQIPVSYSMSPSLGMPPMASHYSQMGFTTSPNLAPMGQNRGSVSESGSTESRLRFIKGSSNDPLDPSYRVHHGRDFQFGRVFKMLWTEPMGPETGHKTKGTDVQVTRIKHGENCYSSIRRFVIVRILSGHCLCLPILTYGRQATKKRGVKPQDHAIVYTKDSSQKPKKGKRDKKDKDREKRDRPTEIEGEEQLRKTAIRMDPLTARDKLNLLSRLNYAKIYTVEYNVKVCFIGKIHDKSLQYFKRDFNLTHPMLPEDPITEFSDDEDDDAGQTPRADQNQPKSWSGYQPPQGQPPRDDRRRGGKY